MFGELKREKMVLHLLELPDDSLCAIFALLLNVGALHGSACTTCRRFCTLLQDEWKLRLCNGASLKIAVAACLQRIMPAVKVMNGKALIHTTFYANGEFEFMTFRIHALISAQSLDAKRASLEDAARHQAARLALLRSTIAHLHDEFAEFASTNPCARALQAKLCNGIFHHINRKVMAVKETKLQLSETLVHAAEYAQATGPGNFKYNLEWSQAFSNFRKAFPDAPAYQGPSPKQALAAKQVKTMAETLELLRWEEHGWRVPRDR